MSELLQEDKKLFPLFIEAFFRAVATTNGLVSIPNALETINSAPLKEVLVKFGIKMVRFFFDLVA